MVMSQCIDFTEISPYNQFAYADTFNLKGFYSSVLHKKGKSVILLGLEFRSASMRALWHIPRY